MIMSLRDGGFPSKQSPVSRGDCFTTACPEFIEGCVRNDMQENALRELQSQSQEELDALLPSVLRPTGGALKGEF